MKHLRRALQRLSNAITRPFKSPPQEPDLPIPAPRLSPMSKSAEPFEMPEDQMEHLEKLRMAADDFEMEEPPVVKPWSKKPAPKMLPAKASPAKHAPAKSAAPKASRSKKPNNSPRRSKS